MGRHDQHRHKDAPQLREGQELNWINMSTLDDDDLSLSKHHVAQIENQITKTAATDLFQALAQITLKPLPDHASFVLERL